MLTKLQRGAGAGMHPLWLRALTGVCLVLITVLSTMQAVHIHGNPLPHNKVQASSPLDASQLPGPEVRCGLCGAMHSMLPVSASTVIEHMVVVSNGVAMVEDRMPVSAWHFSNFSRPPPAMRNS